MNDMVKNILPRLSDNERLVLGLPFEQLDMLGGDPGITVDKHWKVPHSTIKSLQTRAIVRGNIDAQTRILQLTPFGAKVAEAVRAEARPVDASSMPVRTCAKGHVLDEKNLQRVGGAGDRCRTCRNEMHKRLRREGRVS